MSYRPGQRVRVVAREHEGHHRTPAYLKGQNGRLWQRLDELERRLHGELTA